MLASDWPGDECGEHVFAGDRWSCDQCKTVLHQYCAEDVDNNVCCSCEDNK